MDVKSWDETVTVELDDSECREVGDVMEAADCLFSAWPLHEGEAFDRAMKVFAQVLDGRREPDLARKAFIAAAKEARVTVHI
jgi:hypothetical protein